MTDFSTTQCAALVATLSPQQRAVLKHMAAGLATKQIAAALDLEESTVKVYRERLYSKLGVTGLAQAVRVATLGKVL